MSVVALEKVSKWYGEVLGLSDVTLRIGQGITGLLGVNGAGKSTLLRLATGQLAPSRGRVTVLGEEVWNNPALMRRIGFCPEQDSFYEEMSGEAWLAYLGRLAGFGRKEAHARAVALLEKLDLRREQRKRIGRYSKGMRQRLKFAQALLHDPEVLFLDEALTGTDPIGRARMSELIRELARAGRHVVFSSHILHEVEALTDRIVLLHQGRLRAEGRIDEIRRLLVEHPCEVRIEVDRPRELAAKLIASEHVRAVERVEEGAIVVHTTAQETFLRELENVLLEGGFDVLGLTPLDDRLETVFQRLTE